MNIFNSNQQGMLLSGSIEQIPTRGKQTQSGFGLVSGGRVTGHIRADAGQQTSQVDRQALFLRDRQMAAGHLQNINHRLVRERGVLASMAGQGLPLLHFHL